MDAHRAGGGGAPHHVGGVTHVHRVADVTFGNRFPDVLEARGGGPYRGQVGFGARRPRRLRKDERERQRGAADLGDHWKAS
jgi:hypothetical protein